MTMDRVRRAFGLVNPGLEAASGAVAGFLAAQLLQDQVPALELLWSLLFGF